MSAPAKISILECHHTASFDSPYPIPGDDVYCLKCRDWKQVNGYIGQITARCDRCRFSRSYGEDMDAARRAAGIHIMTRDSQAHVTISRDGVALEVVSQDGQGELPLDRPLADRRTLVQSHQNLLKKFLTGLDSSDSVKAPPQENGADEPPF